MNNDSIGVDVSKVTCCRFPGHRDECFRRPEARDAEAKVQSRVQDRGGPPGA
jgi:hypothetical protein